MTIDISYYNPRWSKFVLYADLPLRHAARHLGVAWHGDRVNCSTSSRVKHVAKGLLKLIPVVGYIYTLGDKLAHRKSIRKLTVDFTQHSENERSNAFIQGFTHGQELRKEIKRTYDPILFFLSTVASPFEGLDFGQYCMLFEARFPDDYKQELAGLAEGAGYTYEQVVMIHAFLDAAPGVFGCSAAAVVDEACAAAANHSFAHENLENLSEYPFTQESIERKAAIKRSALRFFQSRKKRYFHRKAQVLRSSNVGHTIQSIFFDITNREIKISSQEAHAAKGRFKTFSAAREGEVLSKGITTAALFRNLDWGWYFLGRKTIVQTRRVNEETTVTNVTFPGYIGTLSGMNNHGLALAVCSNGRDSNPRGLANSLLFIKMLETCKSVDEAIKFLACHPCGSSMNVVIADETRAVSVELGMAVNNAYYSLVEDTQDNEGREGIVYPLNRCFVSAWPVK